MEAEDAPPPCTTMDTPNPSRFALFARAGWTLPAGPRTCERQEVAMKAVVLDAFGEPAEVLQVREVPAPAVGSAQARVRMLASPVNPSDLMTIRGQYGKRPTLPATPG